MRAAHLLTTALLAAGLLARPAGAPAQSAPIDTSSLGRGPGSTMSALLEKTIFNVDVLRLDLRVGPQTQSELAALIRGRAYTDALGDRIAAAALRTQDAWAEITFRRHVSLGRFVDGVDGSLRQALKARIITEANYRTVSAGLPRWFGFLRESGFHEGDRIIYRISPEGLRTQFVGVDGRVRLDQIDKGRDPPLALLGGYFAPGSDFRPLLIRSLF